MTDSSAQSAVTKAQGQLQAAVYPAVGALPQADWDRLFPGEAEGWAYYKACETAPPEGFTFGAIGVWRGAELVAAAPVFEMIYRLDTPLQETWKSGSEWLARHASRLVGVKVVGLGTPLAERLHLGLVPGLDDAERGAAVRCLLTMLDEHAAARRAPVLAIKDLADRDAAGAHAELIAAGFTRVASLPVAVLALPFETEQQYLASLSAATRKDLRRKLKTAGGVRLDYRGDITGLEARIYQLYEETRRHSALDYGDFEQMSPQWFPEIARGLGAKALWLLCWSGEELIGFNLLLVERERIIDKFIGLKYPQAVELNLYAATWMSNVRLCIERGIGRLQTGQTAYTMKVRLGSDLDPSWVYFRHRGRLMNLLFKRFGPMLDFAAHDPELKKLRERRRAIPTTSAPR